VAILRGLRMDYKSPPIHRTPLYRARAAYANMRRRCMNASGLEPAYAAVELRMSLEEWLAWAVPRYEEFERANPGVMPNVSRYGDLGHYEISNLRILTAGQNREEMTAHCGVLLFLRSDGTKMCGMCRKIKSASEFHKNSRRRDGLHAECKSCKSELNRRYKQHLGV